MATYTVTIRRTELISFQIDADNEDDARDTYWNGDETASATVDIEIETVEQTNT